MGYYRRVPDYAYIEQLRLCPLRPAGPLPRVSARLVKLVQDYGAIEPVVVRQIRVAEFEILSNVETWMAAQRARLDRVPVYVLEDISDGEAAEIVRASFTGFEPDPIDEAEYFRDQLERIDPKGGRYRTVAKLAYLTGHARPYISHALRLLKLPESIQTMVRNRSLSAGHARALVGIKSRSSQLALAKRVVREQLSVRACEVLARTADSRSPAPSSGTTLPDPNIARLEQSIATTLGCAVALDSDAATLTISYHNLDILDGVLAKLGVMEC